jgi:hypothetical protein
VLWFDNFVRPRSPHNPMRQGRVHLNSTAMAVMYVGAGLEPFPGMPSVGQFDRRRRLVVGDLVDYQTRFEGLWGAVLEADLHVTDFRVPLDVMRDRVRQVRWLPLALSQLTVQRNVNLLEILEFAEVVRRHSGREVLPLLVDIDLWYRLVKMVYARNMLDWRMSEVLRRLPVLYGLWHPYKYVLTVVYRQFHSFFIYLKEGTVGDRYQTGPQIDIRAVELFIGALLTVTRTERRALQEKIRAEDDLVEALAERVLRLRERVRVVSSALRRAEQVYEQRMQGQHRRRTATGMVVEPMGHAVEDARLQMAEAELAAAVNDLQKQKERKSRLLAFYFLVAHYAPSCLALGVLLRDCTWEHRGVGSGARAKEVLMAALVMLVHLVEREHTVEYVRTLCTSLVMWRQWNDQCPGVCYSEERCEAMLSRLGTRCGQYPRHMQAADVEDLFLAFIGPPPRGSVQLRSHRPTPDLVQAVHDRVRQLIHSGAAVVRYVPWRSQRLLSVEPEWPADCFFPLSLRQPIARDHWDDLLKYELNVLVRSPVALEPELAAKLADKVPMSSATQRQRRETELEDLLRNNPLPERYRGVAL